MPKDREDHIDPIWRWQDAANKAPKRYKLPKEEELRTDVGHPQKVTGRIVTAQLDKTYKVIIKERNRKSSGLIQLQSNQVNTRSIRTQNLEISECHQRKR